MAWLGTYQYRKKITIDSTNIDADLAHFPLPVPLGAAVGLSNQDVTDIFTEVGAEYLKIAVTAADGETQLYVEVEYWDATNSKALLWVSRDTWTVLSAGDTEIYLYFDAAAADNTAYVGTPGNRPEVWDSHFRLVFLAGQLKDSTGNAADATAYNNPSVVDGLIGRAYSFNGTDQYIAGDDSPLPSGSDPRTVQVTVKGGSGFHPMSYGTDSSGNRFSILGDTGAVGVGINGANIFYQASDVINSTGFHTFHIALPAGTSTLNDLKFYEDGTLLDTVSSSVNPGNTISTVPNGWVSGINITKTSYSDDTIEQVRVSSIERSAAWINADHLALADSLLTWGATESVTIALEDISLDLSTRATARADLAAALEAAAWTSQDLAAILEILGLETKDLAAGLAAVATGRQYLSVMLQAHSGLLYDDLAIELSATDGTFLQDLGLQLLAVARIPQYKSVVAQRVSSVVSEVS